MAFEALDYISFDIVTPVPKAAPDVWDTKLQVPWDRSFISIIGSLEKDEKLKEEIQNNP